MKNILLITNSGHIGGVEKITYTLWKELKKKGFNVKVIKIFKSEKEEFFNYGKDEKTIPKNKVLSESNFLKKIYRLVKDTLFISYYKNKLNIDVSIGIGEMCSILNGLTIFSDLKIGSIHGEKVSYKNKIIKYIASKALNNCEKIICISKGIELDIIENFKEILPEKLKIIYNPHDFEKIARQSKEELALEEQKIFSKKTFLYVGRIDENKGIGHLLKIFNQKHTELQEYNLVIIGDYSNAKLKNNLSNVYFLGYKKNPYKYMRHAYCLLLSSYSEGLPNVLIESLGLGIPVISTDSSGGIWEILGIDKENIKNKKDFSNIYLGDFGIITEKLDYNSLENYNLSESEEKFYLSILKMLNKDNYLKFKNNSIFFREKFNKDEIMNKYEKLIKELK
ncbi:MAG: glycosyltransferase [Cetobacterium sp.]